jgi:hypothetical protein
LKRNTKTIIKATKVLEVSEGIGPAPHQCTGPNDNRKTTNKCPERTAAKLSISRWK